MSTLSVGTIQSSTTSPPTIDNSAGTEIGTFCRTWVNFNGQGTIATRASFNVSSIFDNGTGSYTINFTTALVDANYVCTVSASAATDSINLNPPAGVDRTASSLRIDVESAAPAQFDAELIDVAIFR